MAVKTLSIAISQDGPITLVHVAGPADSENIENWRHLWERLAQTNGALILMDCTELTYLNSRAIGLLLKYYRQIAFNRGRLAMYGVNTKLVRTLDLLHIGKELPLYESRDAALSVLR